MFSLVVFLTRRGARTEINEVSTDLKLFLAAYPSLWKTMHGKWQRCVILM